ncbi:S8 family serine peptidase [Bradyrhizobium lablabi]|uniref:S8 family peptidase n=1 Tax=Bradyrhizobium lablabi TaxID=722472 RepID=UPI001BAA792F|nr:S8 family serine peptidase [Bradyrhizobium lablabi]MBR0696737.1 S8 family serine peptidase [Bradyrhizobium lablabi]
MADASITAQSRKIVRMFLKRQARQTEALRSEIGFKILKKLDTVSTRDLIRQNRDESFARLTDAEPPKDRIFKVVVNMRVVRPGAGALMLTRTKRAKRQMTNLTRRSGERALQRLKATADETGARIRATLWLTRSLAVDVNREQLHQFAGREDVRSVNHDKLVITQLLDVSRPLIQADQVENNLGFDGSDVDVAVLDTGIDFNHPALTAVQGTQQDFTGEGVGDMVGHGTHCAGIVASQDRTFRGIAPGCTVHDYKLMSNDGSGGGTTTSSIAVTTIQRAVSDGRDVLSNSWGFSHADGNWVCADGTCVLCTAANAAVDSGVVFVVAAGNEDNDSCSSYDTHLRCPGHATLPITVAATDDLDAMGGFSSLGPTADGRPKPDIAAPGVQINSCKAGTTDFIAFDGTSMAAPHIAGVCALMLEKNPALTPQDVKDIIMRTAVNVGHTPDEMGAGRVNALDAVNAA